MASSPFRPAVLSVEDACRYLAIKKSKLYLLLSAGEIEAVKIGHKTGIVTKSCDDFLDRCPPAYPKSEAV